MHSQYHDRMSPADRHGRWIFLRLAAITAVAFALVAASVSAAPKSLKTSADAPVASAAATAKCTAQIQKGSKLVDVYERYYKYAFKKVKGTKKYRKVIVRSRRKMKVSCTRACVKTKLKKKKRVPVYKTVKKTVTVKKGSRLVKVKKKVRVYVFQKCKVSGASALGTPVKATLLPGSIAHLDFGAFTRDAALSGFLSGFIPGGYQLSQDNQIQFTRGAIQLGQTNVFIDDDCNGGQISAAIRTGTPTNVGLQATRQSISTVLSSGGVTATIYSNIQLPLDLRNDDDGCNSPYITTGYSEFQQTFFLKGKIEKGTGLAKLKLTSAPDPLDVVACLSPGSPTSPCNGFQIPLPIIVNLSVTVNVQIG